MAKIVLDVDNKNKDIVLMILKNLKTDLIKSITVDNKNITSNTAKSKVLEDEFIPKTQSVGKYSKDAYKARLLNKGN